MARTTPASGASKPRKSPLRVAALPGKGSLDLPLPVPRRADLTGAQLRAMQVSEFAQWLRSRTNQEKRPFQEETITAYQVAARALDAWMTPRKMDGDFTACDTATLNLFFRDYHAAAMQALGYESGSGLVSDPAWSAVVLRPHDAEGDGWDPARLLAFAARQRELGTASSIAEVLAWRIDAHLAGNPAPPRNSRPYETAAAARERLAEVARATLGPQVTARAQAELAWPALLAALHRAESTGLDPSELLPASATRASCAPPAASAKTLAVLIHRHLATHPHADAESGPAQAEGPLLWMASRPASATPATSRYLAEAASLISSRVNQIASTAIRHRPPWLLTLGHPPGDPDRDREWLAHVAIVAAYRDQFTVTTSDPAQPLGPYAEPGTPARKPYWHAAESVIAARRLAGLDAPASARTPDAQARAQVAADIYRALPEAERAAISNEMASRPGPHRLGSHFMPDEDAVTQPTHTLPP